MLFEYDRDAVSRRLVEEIRGLGLSYRKLAALFGCEETLIHRYLTGRSIPNHYYLTVLHYAGCDIIYILTGDRRA